MSDAGEISAFDVLQPSERPAIVAIAGEARARLASEVARLDAEGVARLAAMPIASAVAELDAAARKSDFRSVSEGPRSVAARVRPDGRPWSETYARLLTYEILATLPVRRSALNVPRIAWPDMEDGLAAVLRDTAAGIFTEWDEEFFEKDIAVALLAIIGAEGRVVRIERWAPAYLAKASPPSLRLRFAAYLRRDYFRKGFYSCRHQWRGYREVLRRPFAATMEKDAATVAVNPQIDGVLAFGWMCDPALREPSPHFMKVPDGLAAMGGRGFYQTADALSIERAITSSRKRKVLYDAGKYTPINYGVLVARRDVLRWIRGRNLDARATREPAYPDALESETVTSVERPG